MESLRSDVLIKRARFTQRVRRIDPNRLVFLDESCLTITMSRSHAWVKRGDEFIDHVPMNRGKNLTLLGAIRRRGWVVLTTQWQTANGDRFVRWLRERLLPKLRRGDVLVLDNLSAHHDVRVLPLCVASGVQVIYQPPHSPDFNPIESGWALQKQHVRKHAPRSADALRRVARRARYRVTRRHCRQWFAHAVISGVSRLRQR